MGRVGRQPARWREWRRSQLLSVFSASAVMMNAVWALVLWTPFDWFDALILIGPLVGSLVGVMTGSKMMASAHLQMCSDLGIEPGSPETFVKSPRAIARRRARARRTD